MNYLLDVVQSVLENMDITPQFLNDGYFSCVRFISRMLKRNKLDSDFALIILNRLRHNVAYEFGLFQMKGVKIIPIKKKNAQFA